MIKSIRTILLPVVAVAITLAVLWYSNLPAPAATSNLAQVEREAKDGGYRLIDVEALSRQYLSDREKMLLVDTRQEWEHRAGHIADSAHFPIEPTWWARWRSKDEMRTSLGPDKEKTIVFY